MCEAGYPRELDIEETTCNDTRHGMIINQDRCLWNLNLKFVKAVSGPVNILHEHFLISAALSSSLIACTALCWMRVSLKYKDRESIVFGQAENRQLNDKSIEGTLCKLDSCI
ncbi:hypothetical protein RvY_08040-1 [Ramazzottius varieornatus]|uniref:Uncharacterized protein n=1 Tax=Ramazzottius varieornatus TaxID=947166 RepID=A0A1D1V4C8_RAMVA|nr:hypothetical protein RvY_08040-1 [Ramazzottius varieornatus]